MILADLRGQLKALAHEAACAGLSLVAIAVPVAEVAGERAPCAFVSNLTDAAALRTLRSFIAEAEKARR